MKLYKQIIFIHLPKTAGTSFREAAINYFGLDYICCDYGASSEETSKITHQWIIRDSDQWSFKMAFEKKSYLFLSGHFQASRYVQIFGIECAATFLRKPLQRIVSEYRHFLRHHDYNGSFVEFYKTKQFINKQSRMLKGVPWPAIGFIGITECYDESLNSFNNRFGVKFQKLEENISKENVTKDYELDPDQERELRELNAEDLQLYELAYRQFEWRVKLSDEGDTFTRGMIGGYNNKQLKGWAVYDEGDEPVTVEILVNGKSAGRANAFEARPHLKALGIRRGGFVGFSFKIPKLDIGDEVTAFVTDTGQPLANSPWVYSEA